MPYGVREPGRKGRGMLKYIAIGLLVPYCLFLYGWAKNGFRADPRKLTRLPLVLLACAIWSVMPNIADKFGLWPFNKIFDNFIFSNIFFFHGALEGLKTTGSSWGLGIVYFIFFSLMMIFARHLKEQEREMDNLKERI